VIPHAGPFYNSNPKGTDMSNVSDTIELTQQSILHALEPRFMTNESGREFLLQPNGNGQWAQTETTLPNAIAPIAPKIIKQAVRLQTVESLIDYLRRFAGLNSMVFADISTSAIRAMIDYHGAVDPNHCAHSAGLIIPHSIEWQTWGKVDGQLMSHVAFANFLEENAIDIMPLGELRNRKGEIVENAPTSILELCRSLQLVAKHEATSEVRNGDYVSFSMQKGDDITTKQDIEIPVSIRLYIPVYFGEPPALVTALLRRNNSSDGLKMGVKLQRPEMVRQHDFMRIVSQIEAETELATVYGVPS
jgi:uncharacterized protein YfdQ (DUF2303 family)